MYATDVCKMYTTFQQTFVYILYTKSKEVCQLNFVYKMYTSICRIVVYILYTNILYIYILYTKVCGNVGHILYRNILYTFCIHQFWCTKSVHHVYNLYTKFIQNVYTNNCMQNQALACRMGNSLHPCYHLRKSRKRRLSRVMKNLPIDKATWADITRAKF